MFSHPFGGRATHAFVAGVALIVLGILVGVIGAASDSTLFAILGVVQFFTGVAVLGRHILDIEFARVLEERDEHVADLTQRLADVERLLDADAAYRIETRRTLRRNEARAVCETIDADEMQ
jgi:hypothetical protein